jgi:catechol 2,3-dioxygenase-like lactoylglutathione lyase family enzyme
MRDRDHRALVRLLAHTILAPAIAVTLALCLLLGRGVAATESATSDPRVVAPVASVDSVGMTVSDMTRAIDFYTRVLPFTKESDIEVTGRPWEQLHGVFGARMRIVGLRLGDERLELTEYLAPKGRTMPADSRGNDRWFQHVAIIVRDMDRAYARLREHGVVHASTGPQQLPDWNPGAGGIQAFYFRDPDGHFLEVLSFPSGKGDPKWHRPGMSEAEFARAGKAGGANRLGEAVEDRFARNFLGLDHTAIVVGDTDAALAFYRDTLGLRVAGEGENYGIEQERLNGVFGVRLRITTLRAATGTGVELLEYRAPRDGRPSPPDLKANDIAHWQITMRGASALLDRLLLPTRMFGLVSPDITTIDARADAARAIGFSRGLLVRDPDGHAVRVVTP